MRPFGEEPPPRPARDGALDELREAGIDLDPRPGPAHSHPHPHGHPHDPHGHPGDAGEPGELPAIGIVGAGPVGTALGAAFARAGWPVTAVASRDRGRRERFRSFVPGARGFAEPDPLLDEAQLIVLAVPDDAIATLAGRLRLYSGQALVHTSGALGPEVLEPAMAAGTQAGTFHPLVAFADVARGLDALPGSTIAIEADPQLGSLLAGLAEAIGAVPVRLAPGSKAAYHAGAVLAAGGLVALLDAIARLGAVAGLDEATALGLYGRLADQTLANARALGIAAALTGPIARGDAGTLRLHLAALRAHAPDVLPLYRAVAERELAIAVGRGGLEPGSADRIRRALAEEATADPSPPRTASRAAADAASLATEG